MGTLNRVNCKYCKKSMYADPDGSLTCSRKECRLKNHSVTKDGMQDWRTKEWDSKKLCKKEKKK